VLDDVLSTGGGDARGSVGDGGAVRACGDVGDEARLADLLLAWLRALVEGAAVDLGISVTPADT